MAYFTLKIRGGAGELLFESDFTLQELIPLVRQMTRPLARRPALAARPTAYRALITPRYDAPPKDLGSSRPALHDAPVPPPPAAEGSLLQISEADLDLYAPVSYLDELEAFYNPGTSSLCLNCPERSRCPGSGEAGAEDLSAWIQLDPGALRSNEPVTYFTVHIETLDGEVLLEDDVRLNKLQFFVSLVSRMLREAGQLPTPAKGTNRAEIIARYEGQPHVDPLLAPASRPRVYLYGAPASPRPAPEPPRRLVDWDRLEASVPPSSADSVPVDLDIKVFPTETEPLERKPPPALDRLTAMGQADSAELRIILHRSALAAFEAQRQDLRDEVGGVLVGEAYLDPAGERPYVEVVAALAALDERGGAVGISLDSRLLRQIQERVARDYPGRRTVGWYRFHLLGGQRVAVLAHGHLLTAGAGERLLLLDDEDFMHRNFFPQPWHLGVVIDALKETLSLRFYHLRDGEMVSSTGCQLMD